MPRIPGVGQSDAVKVFQKLGYRIARQSGHVIMSNGKVRLSIPRHSPINAITMGLSHEMPALPQSNSSNFSS